MRDIPVFVTENGAASLILKRIPYTKEAYVEIRDSAAGELLIKECYDFCRMAGAERVYATGHSCLESYPFYTDILLLTVNKADLPATDALAQPATMEESEHWRAVYNDKMRSVPNAAYMTREQAIRKQLQGIAYMIYRGSELLGIGAAERDTIEAVASVKPGAGWDVVLSIASVLRADPIQLQVASINHKAMELYRGLGFAVKEQIARWYQIF